MAQILVRGLEDDVRDKLREMAQSKGQSVEETVRSILRDAVRRKKKASKGVGTLINDRFKKYGLKPGEIPEWKGQAASIPEFK